MSYKRLRHNLRDRFTDKHAGANRRLDFILHEKLSDGLDSATEECAKEGDVSVLERVCGDTELEFDWLRLCFILVSPFLDNLGEPLLEVLKEQFYHPGRYVNFLHLEEFEHIGEAADRA